MSPPWRPVREQHLASLMSAPLYSENRASYGLIGAVLVTLGPLVFLARRRLDFPAWLFIGGVAAQVLVAATAGWHVANLRYFAAAACLAWAGLSLVVATGPRWLSFGLTIVAAAGAVLVPVRAAERSPAHLVVAASDRDSLHRDIVKEMIGRARTWKARGELPVVLTAAGGPIFHLYDQLESGLVSIPDLQEAHLLELDDVYRRGEYRILALRVGALSLPNLVEEESLPAHRIRVYVWRRPR
jgi:hypothetical protein